MIKMGHFGRMLKKPASFVLASFRPSTYPRGYASGLHSLRPCWRPFWASCCFSGTFTIR